MSLEAALQANTDALKAFTEALLATVSAPTPSAASAVSVAPASTAATKAVTYDVVGKAITDGVKADRAKVVAVLAEFGAKKGTELKPEQYGEFLAALAADTVV